MKAVNIAMRLPSGCGWGALVLVARGSRTEF